MFSAFQETIIELTGCIRGSILQLEINICLNVVVGDGKGVGDGDGDGDGGNCDP